MYIRGALADLDVEAVNTLIGDIDPPASLMETLTQRKVAEEQQETFKTQRASQQQRQEFEQAKNEADTRGQVVQASRLAEVAKLTAEATVSKAEGEAKAKKVNAEADAEVLRVIGEAKAAQTRAVGDAEAAVLKAKVEAVGEGNWTTMENIRQLAESKTAIVPQIVAGSNEGGMTSALVGSLVARMVRPEQRGEA